MIDHAAAASAWDRCRRGDKNAFTRRIYVGRGPQTFDEIRRRYRQDPEFRGTVEHYVQEFERLWRALAKMKPVSRLPRHISCLIRARSIPCSPMQRGNWADPRENRPALLGFSGGLACPRRGSCQPACKPGSVWRVVGARDGHSSRAAVAGRLRATNPGDDPETDPRISRARNALCRPYSVLLPVGLAMPLMLPCARCALLPHHFTLASRRFVFCGAFPRVSPAGGYPAPRLRGARTFLRHGSGGHPAGWRKRYRGAAPIRQLSNLKDTGDTNGP